MTSRPLPLLFLGLLLLAAPLLAGEEAKEPELEWLVIGPLTSSGRSAFAPDPVAARYILADGAEPPKAGDSIRSILQPWTAMKPDDKGWLKGRPLINGYAYSSFEAEEDGIRLVEGAGHYYFYVNGTPFMGDVYRRGRGPVPVPVLKGVNHLFLRVVRGQFRLSVRKAESPLLLGAKDATLPDVREGWTGQASAAVIVINASPRPLQGAILTAGKGDRFKQTASPVPYVPPFGTFKVPFTLAPVEALTPEDAPEGKLELPVVLACGELKAEEVYPLRFRARGQSYMETFVSEIDGSVQYFAVQPPPALLDKPGALYLSLHGASVEARGQADAYTPKPDGWVVAATNRRPFGFDWEDWGRMDALEVMAVVVKRYSIDENRVFLCGHSMGGHGTWHVGVTHPGLFAGLGPSAGWISFFSYGGAKKQKPEGPQALIERCQSGSDTLSIKENLRDLPIFIIHGEKDDNVPVRESRNMVKELQSFHRDFVYREVPEVKHWWDISKARGADCVDMGDLFDFFGCHRRNPAPLRLAFKTWNPGVSADHRWVRVEGQSKLLDLSSIEVRAEPALARLEVKTENVSRFSFDPSVHFEKGEIKVEFGEETVTVDWPGEGRVHLAKQDSSWATAEAVPPSVKNPDRYGPFKRVFDNRFALVYGTGGTPEENALSLARARFEQQTWWYRGNGAAEILPDTRFDPELFKDRNVILYGHADQNSAFAKLLADSPIGLKRGRLEIGDRSWEGGDIAILFIRPSPLGDSNLVGVVGGTGVEGIQATMRVSYLRSFVQFPDWIAFRSGSKEEGKTGFLSTGLFGPDWDLETGEKWMAKADEEGF